VGALGYSCPIRLVPTYILPVQIEISLLGRFHPDSFKTERLVCIETDRRADDMARSTRLVMLIKNIHIYFMGLETSPLLRCKLLTEIIMVKRERSRERERVGESVGSVDVAVCSVGVAVDRVMILTSKLL